MAIIIFLCFELGGCLYSKRDDYDQGKCDEWSECLQEVSERSERALMKKRILAMNPAKWQQTATSTTKLTLFHPIRLTHFTRFARLSLKMRLASLVAGENVQGDKKVNKVINRFTSLSL